MQTRIWVLHGWALGPGNEQKWQPFFAELKAVGISATFLPLPGLDTDLNEVWTLDEYVNWLATQLPDEPVILLGHSFGGQLAIRFAALYPERVNQLLLLAPAGIIDRSLKAQVKRAVFKGLATVGKVLTSAPLARMILYKLVREQDYFQASPILRKTMQHVISTEIVVDLPKLSMPVLLIWGEHDTATPYRHHQQYLLTVPRLSFQPMSTARHSPQFTHPAETAASVVSFLKETTT